MSARHLLGGFGDAGSLSEGQLDTLDGITWSLSAISAACSFAVVASYWSYKVCACGRVPLLRHQRRLGASERLCPAEAHG